MKVLMFFNLVNSSGLKKQSSLQVAFINTHNLENDESCTGSTTWDPLQ